MSAQHGWVLADILNDEWEAAPPDPDETGDGNWSVIANRVPYIAKVYEPHGEETARLIAAAPELLTEYQRAIDHLRSWLELHPMDATTETHGILYCAGPLIAKATGAA